MTDGAGESKLGRDDLAAKSKGRFGADAIPLRPAGQRDLGHEREKRLRLLRDGSGPRLLRHAKRTAIVTTMVLGAVATAVIVLGHRGGGTLERRNPAAALTVGPHRPVARSSVSDGPRSSSPQHHPNPGGNLKGRGHHRRHRQEPRRGRRRATDRGAGRVTSPVPDPKETPVAVPVETAPEPEPPAPELEPAPEPHPARSEAPPTTSPSDPPAPASAQRQAEQQFGFER